MGMDLIVLLFQLQSYAINLTMSTHQQQPQTARRTSERRRLKLIKNANSFKVPNPFRIRETPTVPDELFRQLRKIEFLSSSVISHLCFDRRKLQSLCEERMLTKMEQAINLQQAKYNALVGLGNIVTVVQGQSNRVMEEKGFVQGEEVVQTKDEISRNIFDPLDPRREDGFLCDQLLVGEVEGGLIKPVMGESQLIGGVLLQEQYQNYFSG